MIKVLLLILLSCFGIINAQTNILPSVVLDEIEGYKTSLFINKDGQFMTKQIVFTDYKLNSDDLLIKESDSDFYYSLDKEDYKYNYYFYEFFPR